VIKSGGSFGFFDLVAINESGIKLIQCKANKKPSKEELERLINFRNHPVNCSKEVWIWKDRSKVPEILYAGTLSESTEDNS
jgi:hypothetical protein